MKHKILMSIFLIGFTACMKVAKKGAENIVAPASTPALQVEEKKTRDRTELTYSYDVDGKANLKKVRFTAATNWPASVVVKKKDGDTSAEFGAEFNENSEWSDLLISENKVNYQFFSKVEDQLILLEEVEVMPPLNIEVIEDLNLAQKYSLNQKTKLIYFENLHLGLQKRIYFENYSGKIKIQNLNSKSGFIQAYSANARAVNDVDGKDGGVLRIEILNGSGDVTVLMKGENGGHGSPAKVPDAAKKGAAGALGIPAQFAFSSMEGFSQTYRCSVKPGDGSNGHKGQEGYDGKSGKSGGHSGGSMIKNYSNQLDVSIEAQAGVLGQGSPGGTGGDGGDPGIGGEGGDSDYQTFLRANNLCILDAPGKCNLLVFRLTEKCSPGKDGIRGVLGDLGLPGGNGVEGTNQKSCLYQGEQKVKCIHE